jgi:hypothetical protein
MNNDPFRHSAVAATIFQELEGAGFVGDDLGEIACRIAYTLAEIHQVKLGKPPEGPGAQITDLFDPDRRGWNEFALPKVRRRNLPRSAR